MRKDKDRVRIGDVIQLSGETDIKLLWGQFLDDFYHAPADERYALIKDEPPYSEGLEEKWLFILAAAAHALANQYGLDVPEWSLGKKYVSEKALYAFDSHIKAHQEYLEETSLPEFKERNLMLGDNILSRC